jgi:hypothetical protein
MLTAEKPARTDLKKEIAARVSIMHWAEALRRRNDAQAKLEVVADAPSEDTTDAVGLIEEYQAATKELLAAEQSLGKADSIPKTQKDEYETRLAAAQDRTAWHQNQASRSYDAVQQVQQDHERAQIAQENERAAIATQGRRPAPSVAPGLAAHPPPMDPFAAAKAGSTHYQDLSGPERPEPPAMPRPDPAEKPSSPEKKEKP